MKESKTYHTKQQAAILQFMSENEEKYVTVSRIAIHLKEMGCGVGLTTIYRHLDKFEKEGIVHKIVLDGNNGACYQYTGDQPQDSQLLLKCEDCGGMIPMDCSHMAPLYEHVLSEHQFRVNPHKAMFYGLCDRCLKKDK